MGLAIVAVMQQRRISALREQDRAVLSEWRGSDSPQTLNPDTKLLRNRESEVEQLRTQIKELVRLRNEVHLLREQNQELEVMRQANAKLLQAIQAAGSNQTEAATAVASIRRQGAFLGISITTANPADPTGVIVQGIHPDAGAAQSDLKPGDVIIALDGRLIETAADLQTEMLTKIAGQNVLLDVLRDGAVVRVIVGASDWRQ